MKSLFKISISLVQVLVIFIVYFCYAQYDIDKLLTSEGISLFIYDNDNFDSHEFLSIIENEANNNDVIISRVISISDEDTKSENVFIYTTDELKDINALNKSYRIHEVAFSNLYDQGINGIYYTNIKDFNVINTFIFNLKDNYDITVEIYTNNIFTQNWIYIFNSGVNILIIALTISFLAFVFMLIKTFKEFSIKKLFGYDNISIALNVIRKFFKYYIVSALILLLISNIYICFYNNLIFRGDLIFVIFLAVLIVFGIYLLICFIITLLFQKIIVKDKMIKHEKPIKLSLILNVSVKTIINSILIFFIINSMLVLKENQKFNFDISKWEVTKNYVSLSLNNPETRSLEELYNTGLKCKNLFELTEKKGGVLFQPSEHFILSGSYNEEKFYMPDQNIVFINKNYLDINPIYDLEKNKVEIDNTKNSLIMLVPIQYKEFNDIILNYYTEWYTWKYYIDQDMFLYGKEMKHEDLQVTIKYVESNQNYFTLNVDYLPENNNYIEDPIAIIVNADNFGGDSYLSFISTGDYLFKSNGNTSIEYFKDDLEKSNLFDRIARIEPQYNQITNYISNYNTSMKVNLYIIILFILIHIILSILVVINFFELNQDKRLIKQLFGISAFEQNINVYLIALLMSFIIIVFLSMIFNNFIMVFPFVALTFLIEITVYSVVIIASGKIVTSKENKLKLKG